MSEGFKDYNRAFDYARTQATATGRDYGIQVLRTEQRSPTVIMEEWSVFALPAPQHRSGRELLCQVVHPGEPA
jgi:hypothetical protein